MLLSRQCFFSLRFVSFFVSNGWWDVLAFVSFSFGVLSGVWGSGSGVGVLAAGRLRPRGECEQVAVLRLGHGASLDPGTFGQRWCKVMFTIFVTNSLKKKRNRIRRVNSCRFSALLLRAEYLSPVKVLFLSITRFVGPNDLVFIRIDSRVQCPIGS